MFLQACDLLPRPAFVSIVSQLVKSTNSVIRRKATDLFNRRMSKNPRPCSPEEVKYTVYINSARIDAIFLIPVPQWGRKRYTFSCKAISCGKRLAE